ncbi:MAG TPA: hypothetical protein VK463_07555 [Desulfomonilaceae bacterium]|nr:hypothetical protein [Desulfomonilaceae bacterium]
MTVVTDPPYEEKQIRCPRLGGPVSFGYCLVERRNLPCHRAIVCWSQSFDAEGFFREKLTDEEFDECFVQPPQPKIVTLIEMIEKARKLCTEKKSE